MSNPSKDKGNRWEYDCADFLTELFGRNFRRSTSGSGAMYGGENFGIKLKGRDTSQVLNGLGDIVPPTGYYVVSECKNYAEFDFHKVLTGKGNHTLLWDWLEEVRHDARLDRTTTDTHLPHWLIVKITRRGEFIALPHSYFGDIFKDSCPVSHSRHLHKSGTDAKADARVIELYYLVGLQDFKKLKDQVVSVISDPRYFSDHVLDLISRQAPCKPI